MFIPLESLTFVDGIKFLCYVKRQNHDVSELRQAYYDARKVSVSALLKRYMRIWAVVSCFGHFLKIELRNRTNRSVSSPMICHTCYIRHQSFKYSLSTFYVAVGYIDRRDQYYSWKRVLNSM